MSTFQRKENMNKEEPICKAKSSIEIVVEHSEEELEQGPIAHSQRPWASIADVRNVDGQCNVRSGSIGPDVSADFIPQSLTGKRGRGHHLSDGVV